MRHSSHDKWYDYDAYDSPFQDYVESFAHVLQGYDLLKELNKSSECIVIDVLSPSGTIRDLFSRLRKRGQKRIGIAISMSDLRGPLKKFFDRRSGIWQLTGDIIGDREKIWNDVDKKLQGKKAALIMQRGLGAWAELPRNPNTVFNMLDDCIQRLNDQQGVLLFQLPDSKLLLEFGVTESAIIKRYESKNLTCEIFSGRNTNKFGELKIVKHQSIVIHQERH